MANARTNRPRTIGDGAGHQRRLDLIGLLEDHADELQDVLRRLERDGGTGHGPRAAWEGRSLEEGPALEMMGRGARGQDPAVARAGPVPEAAFLRCGGSTT